MPALDCKDVSALPSGVELTGITGELRQLVICPPNPTGKKVAVDATRGRTWDGLRAALSLPDERPDAAASPLVCLAYAEAPVIVLADTSTGRWQVYVPTGQCGHYLGQVRSAIAAAIP